MNHLEIFLLLCVDHRWEEVESDDDDEWVAKCKGDESNDHPPIGGVI